MKGQWRITNPCKVVHHANHDSDAKTIPVHLYWYGANPPRSWFAHAASQSRCSEIGSHFHHFLAVHASTQKVHRPRCQSNLHLNIGNIQQIHLENSFSSAQRCFPPPCSSAAACLRYQDHVYITTNELFRFHNDELDKMPCKLDSTENPCLFEKYPTPPEDKTFGVVIIVVFQELEYVQVDNS